jgi:hypothetical protein
VRSSSRSESGPIVVIRPTPVSRVVRASSIRPRSAGARAPAGCQRRCRGPVRGGERSGPGGTRSDPDGPSAAVRPATGGRGVRDGRRSVSVRPSRSARLAGRPGAMVAPREWGVDITGRQRHDNGSITAGAAPEHGCTGARGPAERPPPHPC